MLNILLVHNFYGSAAPSGENQVYVDERELLRRHGHVVSEFTRHSDTVRRAGWSGALRAAASIPWNPFSAAELRHEIQLHHPAVVHAHNTFPLISPSIFRSVGTRAARVLTLHNYRLFCPAAIPLREGKPCTDCLDRHTAWPSLKYGCYRKSRVATLPLAIGVELHRQLGTWVKHVDAFIALSEFQRTMMVSAGLPRELVHVKPNFFPGNPATVPWHERQDYAIFAGRLSEEKGLRSLIAAWQAWGPTAPELILAGDGPLRAELENIAAGTQIRFLGQLDTTAVQAWISRAKLLVLPSEWFEGFPMVIREAFAVGTPAAVSAIGPLPSIVQEGKSGVQFRPGDPADLLHVVRGAWETVDLLERLAKGARSEFELKYNEVSNYAALMSVYEAAQFVQKTRRMDR